MPVQPIDLQTLFAHLNQVGKIQANLKEAVVLQQAAKGNELVKETLHKNESVSETEATKEEETAVHDKEPGEKEQQDQGEKGEMEEEKEQKKSFYTDPALGKNIDITS